LGIHACVSKVKAQKEIATMGIVRRRPTRGY